MGPRLPALAVSVALLLAGCSSGDGDGDGGRGGGRDEQPSPAPTTTAADCARLLPDQVFETLGWTPSGPGVDAGPRGCRREAAEGYVELRERRGYDKLCATLDRTGGVGPGAVVDWLGDGVTACAVEPAGDVGLTKVVVRRTDGAQQVTVAVRTATPREQVRQAIGVLVGR